MYTLVVHLCTKFIKNSRKKQLFYPKILDFMQKHYSVATFVHINLPPKPIFSINLRNSALNIVIMVV